MTSVCLYPSGCSRPVRRNQSSTSLRRCRPGRFFRLLRTETPQGFLSHITAEKLQRRQLARSEPLPASRQFNLIVRNCVAIDICGKRTTSSIQQPTRTPSTPSHPSPWLQFQKRRQRKERETVNCCLLCKWRQFLVVATVVITSQSVYTWTSLLVTAVRCSNPAIATAM